MSQGLTAERDRTQVLFDHLIEAASQLALPATALA